MSATGDALEALYDLLLALSQVPSPKVPEPRQNENLQSRLEEIGGAGVEMLLNIWDDSESDPDELLGADVNADGFEIEREVPVEFIVAGGDREIRRAAFEDGLAAIYDAIKADSTLGGVVDNARMLAPRRNGAGLYVDGMPNILGADIRVRLTFTSSRTF
jgi:hypothetical protein